MEGLERILTHAALRASWTTPIARANGMQHNASNGPSLPLRTASPTPTPETPTPTSQMAQANFIVWLDADRPAVATKNIPSRELGVSSIKARTQYMVWMRSLTT